MAKRKISKKQQRIYRRRRIVAAILALLFLLACAGIVWGIGAGIRALRGGSAQEGKATSSQEAKSGKEKKSRNEKKPGNEEKPGNKKKSKEDKAPAKKTGERKEAEARSRTPGVKKCGPADVELELNAPDPTTGVGGSIDFTAAMRYKGTGSCLIDGSNAGRVLIIKSGDQNIWRSDSCPSDARTLLMARGDKDVQTITWNADASQEECQPDENLPRVNAGSYSAQLVLKSNEKVRSQVVPVMVQ